MKKFISVIFALFVLFSSCKDEQVLVQEPVSDAEIAEGEKVMFTSSTLRRSGTRAINTTLLNDYQTISDDYKLTITMLEEGKAQPVGTCVYLPKSIRGGEGENLQITYDAEGTLVPETEGEELYWSSNVKKYAFEVTAGTTTLEADQSTPEKLLLQDRLHGYAFSPVTHPENIGDDKIDAPNYHTSRDWYQLNKEWHDEEGVMKQPLDYKKIPLFLQHERAWVTVILKAGKGVRRESVLAHPTGTSEFNQNVEVNFFGQYQTDAENNRVPSVTITKPLVSAHSVEYKIADSNGPVETVPNLRYDAIVEPYNYLENPKDDKIAGISLSGLNFSFYASNDENYNKQTDDDAIAHMQAYNLTAGKHLIIEATLSSQRIVFITAHIEDWEEVITSTICDDYGQNGDPIVITSRKELLDFLNDPDANRAGNVAVISAVELDLDKEVNADKTTSDDLWSQSTYQNFELKATLNLAGARLETSGRLFKSMASTANLINGTVVMKNTTPVMSAIAETNEGTIERVNVLVYNKATASRAGMVETNHGMIHDCHSAMPVDGVEGSGSAIYVGGIAAQSIVKSGSGTSPMIDGCVVTARVKGATGVYGGGIVGLAEGRLTNNTFDYGISLLQSPEYFKNIVAATPESAALSASDNSWPTIAENSLAGDNISSAIYDNVLDSQVELEALLTFTYNKPAKEDGTPYRYRISDNFVVMADTWDYGMDNENYNSQDGHCNGNIYCELYGNNKTITLDGSQSSTVPIPSAYNADNIPTTYDQMRTAHMLFSNITGLVQDLTIELAQPLIATPGISTTEEGHLNATDAIAPLAYSVRGGRVSNVKVKVKDQSGAYVQSATPAGLVCWATDGGVVENCQVDVPVLTWMPKSDNTEATRYAGGIVACACVATIKNCIYYTSSDKTLRPAEGSGTLKTYFGGILGATAQKVKSDDPRVSIIDCASKYAYPDETDNMHGSILGLATYEKYNVKYSGTVIDEDNPNKCQGNWWQFRGIGTRLNGTTIEGVIGRCNSVDPTQNDNF